jgi:hypothetical protein
MALLLSKSLIIIFSERSIRISSPAHIAAMASGASAFEAFPSNRFQLPYGVSISKSSGFVTHDCFIRNAWSIRRDASFSNFSHAES